MQAGKLRHRIIIQRPAITQDENTGAIIEDWQDLATVWASVEPLSAREFIASATTQNEITARAVIRYRSDINSTMRLKHRGQLFSIQGILEDIKSGLLYQTLLIKRLEDERF